MVQRPGLADRLAERQGRQGLAMQPHDRLLARIPHRHGDWVRRLPVIAVAIIVLIQVLAAGNAAFSSSARAPDVVAAAKLCIVKTQSPTTGRLVIVYKTKLVKVKVNGKTVKKRVFVRKKGK